MQLLEKIPTCKQTCVYQVNSKGYCTQEYHYWISLAAEALLHWGEIAGEVDDRQSFMLSLKCAWLRGRKCLSVWWCGT